MNSTDEETRGPDENFPLLHTVKSDPDIVTTEHDPKTTIRYCWLLMIFIAASYAFTEAPQLWFYESSICRQYYRAHDPSMIRPDGSIPEIECKLDAIQHDVATITSRQVQINCLVSIFASFHTAILSRKIGRKLVLQLNMLFYLLSQAWIYVFLYYTSMPIQLTWISSAFLLVASGPEMRVETIFMILTDATPTRDQLTVFIMGQIIVYPFACGVKLITAHLMHHSIPIPLGCGYMLMLAAIILARQDFLPSPQHHQLITVRQIGKEMFQFFSLSWTIGLLASTYLATTILNHAMSGSVFLQYAEKQLNINISNASKLQVTSDIMNMVLLLFALAVFGNADAAILADFGGHLRNILDTYVGRARVIDIKDLRICLYCTILMAVGFLTIGIAHGYVLILLGLLLCAAGQSYRMSARSALNAIIQNLQPVEDHTTGLYTIILYIDLLGGIFNSYALATFFTTGLKLGGAWVGLPFFYGAFMWSVTIVFVILVRKFQPLRIDKGPSDQSENALLNPETASENLRN